ncbi:MAG: condensation domain-containing protein [Sideroxyarcus sp.]|nr:condensation domain-containing protein [Sideroxyarcus sp.]
MESRDLDRHQGISGCFLNEMLFLGIAQSHFSYHDYFLKTQDQLMSSDEHKVYPLARLLQEMDRSLDSLGPIFVNFSSGGADTALGQVALGHSEGGFCTGDLDLVISPRRDGIYLDCQYKTSRFKRSTVERIVHLLTETLMSMCDNVNAKPCV